MLFIFDLDFTIWDCGGTWCDHTIPPFKKNGHSQVFDAAGRKMKLYPDSLSILEKLLQQNIQMAVASRTGEPSWAMQLLQLFEIDHFFKFKEIYPGSKMTHFKSLQKKTGFLFNEMFFFDDEYRNIDEVGTLGVNCYFVEDGIKMSIVNEALEKYVKIRM